jgi:Holliday junction resolvase RusA-like endonuclease
MSKSKRVKLKVDFTDLKNTLDQLTTNTIYLTIKGRIPSKKNSRNLFVRGGRLMNIPSTKYAAWHKEAIVQIPNEAVQKIKDVDLITLSFWAPDKRASDLTNKAESIMDLLVDAQVIPDDNWWIVNRVELIFKGVDRKNPRCEVYISGKNTNESQRL